MNRTIDLRLLKLTLGLTDAEMATYVTSMEPYYERTIIDAGANYDNARLISPIYAQWDCRPHYQACHDQLCGTTCSSVLSIPDPYWDTTITMYVGNDGYHYMSWATAATWATTTTGIKLEDYANEIFGIDNQGPITPSGRNWFQNQGLPHTIIPWFMGLICELISPPVISGLRITYNTIANVSASGLTAWNTFFGIPPNANTGFTSEVVTGNTVALMGPSALTLKYNLFKSNTAITSVVDDLVTSVSGATSSSNGVFNGCTNLTTVSLSETIILGGYAFYGCTTLSRVNIPKTTTIGASVFQNCSALSGANFPACTTIGASAFQACTSLSSVTFPVATTIEAGSKSNGVFYGCSSLLGINFPLATTIGAYAFGTCTTLSSITFPEAITIEGNAFDGCTSLSSLYLPKTTTIGASAFGTCRSLSSITFPEVTTIDQQAFGSCFSLSSVTFPVLTTIGIGVFSFCTKLSSLYFPSATTIGDQAFGNSSLSTVSLPKAITIGQGSFYGCPVTSVTFPEVTTIGVGAFQDCTALTYISFPSATTIGQQAFQACSALTYVSLPMLTSLASLTFRMSPSSALTYLNLASCTTIGLAPWNWSGCTLDLYIPLSMTGETNITDLIRANNVTLHTT